MCAEEKEKRMFMIAILMLCVDEGELLSFQEIFAQIGKISLPPVILREESAHPLLQISAMEEMLLPGAECLRKFLQPPEREEEHCRIRTAKQYYDIPYEDILFIESECKKSVIYTKRGRVAVPVPLYRIKQELPGNIFLQTHRSFIVHIENIHSIDKMGEAWEISFAGNAKRVPISRTYRKEFLQGMEALSQD